MAVAMIPLIGLAGSAVDVARLYVVRARLQQACDAGVLAGRKSMTNTQMSTPLEKGARDQAQAFFRSNFATGWFQTRNISFSPKKASVDTSPDVANGVTGTAKANVPMAVMSFFGIAPQVIDVTCQAVFDIPDADVMFVLDTTGSMSCYPNDPAECNNGRPQTYTRSDQTSDYYVPEKGQTTNNGTTTYSRLESLRQSVMLFDNTLRGSADKDTHIRYGFVTYASAVNVGSLIPAKYLQTNWTHRSRRLSPVVGPGGMLPGDYASGDPSDVSLNDIPQSECFDRRYPATGFSTSGPTWSNGVPQARHYYDVKWNGNGNCSGKQQTLRPFWRYENIERDVSDYLRTNSAGSGATIANPTRLDGATTRWRGCIEELNTTTSSSFDLNNLPDDLNPDVAPTVSSNLWRPLWPDVEYRPKGDIPDERTNDWREWYGFDTMESATAGVMCGMPARRLAVMSAQDVHDYVYHNDFRALGGTYHDVGMIWGTRLIAPKGIFGADTAAWSGRKEPSRSIVFMTDGTLKADQDIYGQYGIEEFDNRTGGAGDSGRDNRNHIARFRTECDAAKQRGITIYVVSVAAGITDDLRYCASPGQAYSANSTDAMKSAFRSIAQRVAMLRITR